MPGLGRQAERQVVLCGGGGRCRKRHLSRIDRSPLTGCNERVGGQYPFTGCNAQSDDAHLRAIARCRGDADVWAKGNGNPKRLLGTQRHEDALDQAFAIELMARQDAPV